MAYSTGWIQRTLWANTRIGSDPLLNAESDVLNQNVRDIETIALGDSAWVYTLSGGTEGQIIYITSVNQTAAIVIANGSAQPGQKIYTPGGVNLFIGVGGGIALVCTGSEWYVMDPQVPSYPYMAQWRQKTEVGAGPFSGYDVAGFSCVYLTVGATINSLAGGVAGQILSVVNSGVGASMLVHGGGGIGE